MGPLSLRRHRVAIDVAAVAPHGARRVITDIVFDAGTDHPASTTVLTCLPGGGMSRRYFDLRPEGEGDAYSMAAYLAARGVVVVLLDHPAVGDSDVPDDAWALTPAVVARVNAHATRTVLDGLRSGSLVPELAPLGRLRSVGCGHSMGGMLTVHQQAHDRTHEALALLGFAGGGLVEHLSDEERSYAHDPQRTARDIVELTRRRNGRPLSRGTTGPSPFLLAVPVPDVAVAAITDAGANLLNICGLTSMIPGSSRPQLEAVDVPVFIGVGEYDITGPSHVIPAQFPASRDVTLFVCPRAGHNHNVAPTRALLWDRLVVWLRQGSDGFAEERDAGHP